MKFTAITPEVCYMCQRIYPIPPNNDDDIVFLECTTCHSLICSVCDWEDEGDDCCTRFGKLF